MAVVNLSNEAKVAITIVAALIVAFFGFRLMNDVPIFRQSQKVVTYFDKVDGLTTGSVVYINGVKVGSVKRIELISQDSVMVSMNFDLGVDIPKNSIARLESSGLLDDKAIILEPGDSNEYIEYGDTIKGVYTGGMMETLKDEGQKLSDDVSQSFEKLNVLLEKLNTTISDENQNKIDDILVDLKSTTDEISQLMKNKRGELESSINHASNILANLDTVSTNNKERIDSVMIGLDNSLKRIESLSVELEKTGTSLNQILDKVNKGEGTLGKLVNNPSLYNNLDSLSAEMKQLMKNINEDPRKYLKHMRLIEVF
ncbi:MAG: MlaD family protein [Candidatus Halalkalibacterium sp. M3_1C_030]